MPYKCFDQNASWSLASQRLVGFTPQTQPERFKSVDALGLNFVYMMHRCLTIIEVQYGIFCQIVDGSSTTDHDIDERPDPVGQATLARLARTCRTFSNAALDVLWKHLYSFTCLAQCLPPDLWKIDRTGKRITFRRAMSLSDWEVLSRYSSRVRSLSDLPSVNRQPRKSLDRDAILTLSRPPYYGPLIPHLKTLHWENSSQDYEPLLHLLLTPSLVDIALPYSSLRWPAMSLQLTSKCPSLTHLCIKGEPGFKPVQDADAQRIVSEIVLRLSSLEIFNFLYDPLDDAAIVHLSQLPSLTVLLMRFQRSQLETLRPYLTPSAFGSLQGLFLVADTLSTLASLLETMHFELRMVFLIADGSPIQAVPHALLSCSIALAKACDFEQLSEISLQINWNRWLPGVERQEVSLSTFQPLLSLPNVNVFMIEAMCNISFDDDAIRTLTKHWPGLTELSLNSHTGWGIKSRVTHRGLITLLSNCPDLCDLDLAVDLSEIDQSQLPEPHPGNGVVSYCRRVCFIESVINHPITIATFLGDICPWLDDLSSYWVARADMLKYGAKWNEVKDLLTAGSV